MITNRRLLPLLVFWMLMSASMMAGEMRGMWVYKTRDIAASEEEKARLFAFCEKRIITDLFWQVHFSKPDEKTRVLENAEMTRAFLQKAHAHHLRIHALFGDPSHAQREKHHVVLASADAVIAFNQAGPAEARFDGIHLDIEPHGLTRWKKADVAQKRDLLTQFVEVHHLAAKRLDEADAKLILGADIVFWLDKTNDDGSALYPVTVGGVTRDPAQHLLDAVDHLAIMSYRSKVEGANGMIPLVAKTIASADASKARVFVGAKMADIGPKMETFFGQTESQMMQALARVDETYRPHPGYAGLAFFNYEAFKTMPP